MGEFIIFTTSIFDAKIGWSTQLTKWHIELLINKILQAQKIKPRRIDYEELGRFFNFSLTMVVMESSKLHFLLVTNREMQFYRITRNENERTKPQRYKIFITNLDN